MPNRHYEKIERTQSSLIAISNGSLKVSYGELVNKVTELSNELKKYDITTLGLYADNGPNWIIADLACQVAGITFIPLPLFFSEQQLEHTVKSCGDFSMLLTDRVEYASKFFNLKKQS